MAHFIDRICCTQQCEPKRRKGRTCFAMGRVSSVYNSSMSWLSAVDRLRLFLRQLLDFLFLLLELEVIGAPQPDDGLSGRVYPVVVFAIGELRALADDWLHPVALHVPDASLLECNLGCVRAALLRAIWQNRLDRQP